ncbi:carboxymuconolactone decarboxylase family protein [Nonomuraea gerenzanensis]|uniref:4-carboxymuconolactone decarboxylase domain/alkylhydroperoxidase AhpD family core domain protein n=1 Tax=Nonomuraea gerenzanensis TaxID=93944 RepID=A0A1M4EQL5_9ACTN|nr:carboxymuconolactone decarboxylase family protein [Nonomuraea gerenzanensis]UBU12561.1 carboxymuconolactone decarboxylase family protein [Nonomuraea gerenzanensis]SBP01114.1 4-carboxymuconolactone decarboxylase domain/alkylhydroperoxidase AhpD family core domain protein [Nonomuraea gerenzanensis]
MEARMKNPATIIPAAMKPIMELMKAAQSQGLPMELMEMIHLRVSQINGCSFCVDTGLKSLRKLGESDERIGLVAAWREAPYYTDAERAALELAEAATRLADHTDAVSDEVWDNAADHFDENQLASILLMIAVTNLFNRLNAPIRQVAGSW